MITRERKSAFLNWFETNWPASAALAKEAKRIIGTQRLSEDWLTSEIPALGGRTPIDVYGDGAGANAVYDELHRLEHGIFS